jgi:predicted nuclease of predicted toxin-antitoxin system
MTGKSYLLDANIFIQAKRIYYRFKTFPSFWDLIVSEHSDDKLFSIDKVQSELLAINDDLADWLKNTLPKNFFRSSNDQEATDQYQILAPWVYSLTRLSEPAKIQFLDTDNADAFLVAYARAHDLILVTQELPAPNSQNIIKIPDVCDEFDVEWMNTFDWLEELDVQF